MDFSTLQLWRRTEYLEKMVSLIESVSFGCKKVVFLGAIVPGAGAFELALHEELTKFVNEGNVKGKARFGVQAYAAAFLIVPKTLAQNAGYDAQDVMVKLQEEYRASQKPVGVDCDTGTE